MKDLIMAKDPAFLLYSSDFISGVADLTMEERGQYITLLCLQHQKEELTPKTIKISVPNVSKDVLSKFEKLENGNYTNIQLCETIAKRTAHGRHQKFKAYQTNAIIRIKKQFGEKALLNFKKIIRLDNIDYSEFSNDDFKNYFDIKHKEFANAVRTPLENKNETENEIKNNSINVSFLEFWDLYDKKIGEKEKIENKWLKLSNTDRELIMEYVPKYKLAQSEKKFRKNASTFLNNKSWLDELIYENGLPKKNGKLFNSINEIND